MSERDIKRHVRLAPSLAIPDSLLVRDATDISREHSIDLLFAHSMRVYLFAAEHGRQGSFRYDPELLFVAAAFHDLRLTTKLSSKDERFEVDGANAARQLLTIPVSFSMCAEEDPIISVRSCAIRSWPSILANVSQSVH